MEELSEAIVQSLIAANLYEKEARAMVKTCRHPGLAIRHSPVLHGPSAGYQEKSASESRAETMQFLVNQVESMTPETEQKTIELVTSQPC